MTRRAAAMGKRLRSARRLAPGCRLLVAAAAGIASLAALEVAVAGWAWRTRVRAPARPAAPVYLQRDAALGWLPMPNRRIEVAPGRWFTTDPKGRRRSDPPNGRPRLLVIGDSFTHAVGVPAGAVFADVVADRLGLAAVVLGVEGYGTLQEVLVARELAREIPSPVLLLVQLTGNDPINNSLALERRSWVNNNLVPRPYLESGDQVAVRDPRRLHERFALGRELTRRVLARRTATIENDIERGAPDAIALYRRELGATARALELLRETFPRTRAAVFVAGGGGSRLERDLVRLAGQAGFTPLELEPELSRRAARRNVLRQDGAHWNELGHRLAGEILAERLVPLLPRPDTPQQNP
jgi:lysophospholipase L1-like esterase